MQTHEDTDPTVYAAEAIFAPFLLLLARQNLRVQQQGETMRIFVSS
jgi:hypothetical protein